MNRRTLYIIGALALFGLGAVVGVSGWILISGGTGEASGPPQAPTLDLNATAPSDPAATQIAGVGNNIEALGTQVAAQSTQIAFGGIAEGTQNAALYNAFDSYNALATQAVFFNATQQAAAFFVQSEVQTVQAQVDALAEDLDYLVASGDERATLAAITPTATFTPLPTLTPTNTHTPIPPTATPAPTNTPTPLPTVIEEAAASVSPFSFDRALYRIDGESSEVRFLIDELLLGAPNTVIGRTNQVAGDLIVDFANPAASQLGTVVINVRTLLTDNEFRNRALRGQILESSRDEFEFAQFEPAALAGLPDSVAVGDPVAFQISGSLTIHGMTQPVTFDTTVTVESEDRISGTATATVLYRDFNMRIPNAPGVAGVSDEVVLEIDFVANRVEQ